MRRTEFNEQGFALVAAIFLLVVLSALGVAIVSFSGMQQTGSALDIQGSRAYQAARAGIEWGLYRSLVSNSGACPAASSSFALPAASSQLAGFTVTVTCTGTTDPNTNPPVTVMQLVATACNQPDGSGNCPGAGGSPDYVQRSVTTIFTPSQSAPVIYRRELP